MVKAIDENTLSARLNKAGMRLERRGEHFRLLSGDHVLIERGPDGGPLTLDQIESETRRLDV
jgi:hypothetical protein